MAANPIRLAVVLVLFWVTLLRPASAAEISLFSNDGEAIILVSGEIQTGDFEAFVDALEDSGAGMVVLASPGGDLREGLAIASEIALLGLTTFVEPGSACFSACALMWVSGATRIMDERATIGVHAAYHLVESINGERQATVSSVGNANVGAYLNALGLDREAIEFFVSAPPESIEILTPASAQALNIPFELSRADGGRRLVAQASPPHFAQVAARYIAINASCTPVFGSDPAFYRAQSQGALQEVHALIGPEAGFDLLSQEMRGIRADRDAVSPLDWCIGALLDLADAGMPLGIHGPSFSCARAETPPEVAICDEPRLWILDRALSTSYSAMRQILAETERQELLAGQRAWLGRRDACDADAACLEGLYQSRLRVMRID